MDVECVVTSPADEVNRSAHGKAVEVASCEVLFVGYEKGKGGSSFCNISAKEILVDINCCKEERL
jgi:hypothetical protein